MKTSGAVSHPWWKPTQTFRRSSYELMLESRRRPEIRPLLEKIYDHYRQAARDGMARLGITDAAMGDLVFATLDGLVFQQVTFGNRQHTEAVTERLRDLMAGYLRS